MGIQRYLRQQAGKPGISILDRNNSVFSNFRATLDMRISKLDEEKGNRHSSQDQSKGFKEKSVNFFLNKDVPFEQSCSFLRNNLKNLQTNSSDKTIKNDTQVEEKLWEYGLIGDDTAEKLLNAVMYHNYTKLKIITTDDHWNLHLNHFRIVVADGELNSSFLEFDPSASPRLSMCNNLEPEKVKIKFSIDQTNQHCVGYIYKKYIELLPTTNGRFYHHIVLPTLVDNSIRLSDQSIGKNRIRTMIKQLNEKVQLLMTSLLLKKSDLGHSNIFSLGNSFRKSNNFIGLLNQTSAYNNQKITQFIQHQLSQQLLKRKQVMMFDDAEEKFRHTNNLLFDEKSNNKTETDELIDNKKSNKSNIEEKTNYENDTNSKNSSKKSSEASSYNLLNFQSETSLVENKSETNKKSTYFQILKSNKKHPDNYFENASQSNESTLEISVPNGINKVVIRSNGKERVIDLSDI